MSTDVKHRDCEGARTRESSAATLKQVAGTVLRSGGIWAPTRLSNDKKKNKILTPLGTVSD